MTQRLRQSEGRSPSRAAQQRGAGSPASREARGGRWRPSIRQSNQAWDLTEPRSPHASQASCPRGPPVIPRTLNVAGLFPTPSQLQTAPSGLSLLLPRSVQRRKGWCQEWGARSPPLCCSCQLPIHRKRACWPSCPAVPAQRCQGTRRSKASWQLIGEPRARPAGPSAPHCQLHACGRRAGSPCKRPRCQPPGVLGQLASWQD